MTLTMLQIFAFRLLSAANDGKIILIDGIDSIETTSDSIIGKFTTISLSLSIVVAVVLVAIGGYKMIGSKGDAKAIQDAQDQIQNAIMGFVLILAAVTIIRIIFTALDITDIGFQNN